MSDDKVEVTERITFLENGGSHHEWRLPDGTTWMVQDFEASPVMFQKSGMEWGLETAAEARISSILRLTYIPKDEVERGGQRKLIPSIQVLKTQGIKSWHRR